MDEKDVDSAPELDDEFDMAIAAAIRGKMAERNITQVDVSDRTGIPVTTFARYYKGIRPIPASKLVAVSNVIGVEVGEIIQAAQNILEAAKK